MSPRDPLWEVRDEIEYVRSQNGWLKSVSVPVGLAEILIAEHDQLSNLLNYDTSCVRCAEWLDDQVEMDEHEYAMFEWGWQ
ncbi:hypothetical protein L3Y21_gp068 [Gordonia phage Rabbitrun]|uniref:Uncharacterized protein n=1 Tax=Gordonia phage Rabbitrun TaxID=2762280 RepID=A0A7G8LIN8_9CAUD|nr:hypothetical protein L3Y21_gp068 [Gordonia phage Rabbitrun]QNJ57110.1 hypothetical protein SEA_RABBITRUN_68 [Gordonia phage Rabbitrun]